MAYGELQGPTSYELYLAFAKFSAYVLYYASKDDDICKIGENFDSHKITGSLRIMWLIEVFGPGILIALTKVPASYFAKLKNKYWNDVQNETRENSVAFTNKYLENAKQMIHDGLNYVDF